eukprot:10759743-Lingulodinium_polyedra.AAC.1
MPSTVMRQWVGDVTIKTVGTPRLVMGRLTEAVVRARFGLQDVGFELAGKSELSALSLCVARVVKNRLASVPIQ